MRFPLQWDVFTTVAARTLERSSSRRQGEGAECRLFALSVASALHPKKQPPQAPPSGKVARVGWATEAGLCRQAGSRVRSAIGRADTMTRCLVARAPPLVSCLMVTLPLARRFQAMRRAIDSYLAQTYGHRELVIVHEESWG